MAHSHSTAESKTNFLTIEANRTERRSLYPEPITTFRVLPDGRYAIIRGNHIYLENDKGQIYSTMKLPTLCDDIFPIHGGRLLCQADVIKEGDPTRTFILDINNDLILYAEIDAAAHSVVPINSDCIVGTRRDEDKSEVCSYNLSTAECKTTVIQSYQGPAKPWGRPLIDPKTGYLLLNNTEGSLDIYRHTRIPGEDKFDKIGKPQKLGHNSPAKITFLNDGNLLLRVENYPRDLRAGIYSYPPDFEGPILNFLVYDNTFTVLKDFNPIKNFTITTPQALRFKLLPLPDPVIVCFDSQELFILDINSGARSSIQIDPYIYINEFDITPRGEIVVVATDDKCSDASSDDDEIKPVDQIFLHIDLEFMKKYRDGVLILLQEDYRNRNTFPELPSLIHSCLFSGGPPKIRVHEDASPAASYFNVRKTS